LLQVRHALQYSSFECLSSENRPLYWIQMIVFYRITCIGSDWNILITYSWNEKLEMKYLQSVGLCIHTIHLIERTLRLLSQ